MFSTSTGTTFPLDDSLVVKHRPTDGAVLRKWAIDDLKCVEARQHNRHHRSAPRGWRYRGLHGWTCLLRPPGECWLVPQHDLRLSAGVLLKTLEPCIVIPTHIGKILLIECGKKKLQVVTLDSFFEGLRAVRRKFERELEEGRQEATTVDERVANLRKCRERMAAYSDRVVVEHMAVLPVRWKARVVDTVDASDKARTVVRLTTADGCAVDGHRETNVAVVDTAGYCILVHVTERGTVEMECKSLPIGPMHDISPSGSSGRCCSKVFGQLAKGDGRFTESGGALHRIRYVRDPIAGTDSIQTSEVIGIRRDMVPVQHDGTCGTTSDCRWLVFRSSKWMDGAVYDTELDKMACLPVVSAPTGVIETADGLWMWGRWHAAGHRWTEVFRKDVLLSLPYEDVAAVDLPPENQVDRRVLDDAVEQALFQRLGRDAGRREHVHPGHYWVVAGYGPVPTRLRAPEHIYKQLQFRRQLQAFKNFPLWTCNWESQPFRVGDSRGGRWNGSVWAGAVDVRDDVTLSTIDSMPEFDAWCSGGRQQSRITRGDFVVKGDVLTISTDRKPMQVTVAPGRWLWKLENQQGSRVTIWHESISEDEIPSYEWRDTCLLDVEKFERRMMELDSLAAVIPTELRAKVVEHCEGVNDMVDYAYSILLIDKAMTPSSSKAWKLQNSLAQSGLEEATKCFPLPGGVLVDLNPTEVSRRGRKQSIIATSKKMIRIL